MLIKTQKQNPATKRSQNFWLQQKEFYTIEWAMDFIPSERQELTTIEIEELLNTGQPVSYADIDDALPKFDNC